MAVPVLVLAIVLLAPVTEELLFRGTLLRSLLRKVAPASAVLIERGRASVSSTRSATRRWAR